MKVNVKLDIDDTERDSLADYIDSEKSKRLATRKDVNSFVQGCIDAAIMDEEEAWTSGIDTRSEEAEIASLRFEGMDDSYIRGWLQVKKRDIKKAPKTA